MNLETVLKELVLPMVNDKDSLDVRTMPSLNEDEVLLYVYAKNEDIARLIGKQGIMATSLRQMMSIAQKNQGKRITIKFESL